MATIKSIEEKAKAYDGNYKTYTELINRLEDVKNAIKKQNYGIAMDILYKPYPEYQITTSTELKECEDLRITKAIKYGLDHVFTNNTTVFEVTKEQCLAWLEKQGKKDLVTCPICGWEIKKQGEQKFLDDIAKEVTKDKDAAISFLKSTGIINEKGELADEYKIEQDEQNPVWSEEDEDYYDAIIAKLEVTQDDALLTDNQMKFLKSLKDRVHPQPKQEWSEEDERLRRKLIELIYAASYCDERENLSDWLKSLKERCNWEPSDEQMDALHYVTNFDYGGHKATLVSLYEQLKKLKG